MVGGFVEAVKELSLINEEFTDFIAVRVLQNGVRSLGLEELGHILSVDLERGVVGGQASCTEELLPAFSHCANVGNRLFVVAFLDAEELVGEPHEIVLLKFVVDVLFFLFFLSFFFKLNLLLRLLAL